MADPLQIVNAILRGLELSCSFLRIVFQDALSEVMKVLLKLKVFVVHSSTVQVITLELVSSPVSRTDILGFFYYSVVALRVAMAVLGKKVIVCPYHAPHTAHFKHPRVFVVTGDIHCAKSTDTTTETLPCGTENRIERARTYPDSALSILECIRNEDASAFEIVAVEDN